MKRLLVLAFSPMALFALEPVNLIKDAGFEKDSEVWLIRSEASGPYDSTIINRHDPDSAYVGGYCSTIDERIKPWPTLPTFYFIEGCIYQIPLSPKLLSDLDSLDLFHMVIYTEKGNESSICEYGITLKCTYPNGDTIRVAYYWLPPTSTPAPDAYNRKLFPDTIAIDEFVWFELKRDLKADLIEGKGLPEDATVDTFQLYSAGIFYGFWEGQKAFFDAIQLTGYADYDVGVKEILSGDSVWTGVYYKPVARIKSFGREPADDFLAIAEMRQGESLVWADTIPYTLPADTEDTLEFDSFPVPDALSYTLTVRTVMEPDESNEDDAMSKPLYGTGIAENPESSAFTLEVQSFAATPRISYYLPAGQSGTLAIYDASGRKVESRIVTSSGEVGMARLSSGVYFVRLETGKVSVTKKTVILRQGPRF